MSRLTPHTSTNKGKRVKVTLKDGDTFIDYFEENTGKFVTFRQHKVRKGDIAAFVIWKEQTSE